MLATHETADINHRLSQIELLLQRLVTAVTPDESFDGAKRQLPKFRRSQFGRRVETQEVALYVEDLRGQGRSWKQVFALCRSRWPDDPRVRNAEQIRATHRRHVKREKCGLNPTSAFRPPERT